MKNVANRSSPVFRTRCLFNRDSDGDMCWAQLNEVIVVAADRPCRFADGLNLNSRHRWQATGKKLVLHFSRDGDLILQAAALVFLFDELADRTGHSVERFSQLTQLVTTFDLDAMGKIHGLHVLRPAVEIRDGPGNPASEYEPSAKRRGFD